MVRIAVTCSHVAGSRPVPRLDRAKTAACRFADLTGASEFFEDEIRVGVPVSREEPFQLTVLRRHAREDGDVITNSAHSPHDILLGFPAHIAHLRYVQCLPP